MEVSVPQLLIAREDKTAREQIQIFIFLPIQSSDLSLRCFTLAVTLLGLGIALFLNKDVIGDGVPCVVNADEKQ